MLFVNNRLEHNMIKMKSLFLATTLALTPVIAIGTATSAKAESAAQLNQDSIQALQLLCKTNPVAADLSRQARAELIFPNIVKAGLVFGGAYGEGELLQGSKIDGYYNSVTGSWGLQAGAQSYGYIVFLMNGSAVKYIHDTQGLEIGVGPTVVVVDQGVAKNLSTSTLKDDAYAFIFNQQGLMAGVSIEGTKISRINP
jgi:lipid-binding SYLF domain-containing protein